MLAWKIAWRYLLSKKSHSAVNIISIVSICGVAVATAAIVIVLSVFNGFTRLAESHLAAIDPDIKVVPAHGKTFANADSMAAALTALPEVEIALPVVEERGLLVSGNEQMPVIFKGVAAEHSQIADIDSVIIDGAWLPAAEQLPAEIFDMPTAAVSVGVALNTGVRPTMGSIATLYVPRRVGRINPANPSASFRESQLLVSGVFQVDQPEYDNEYVLLPLSVARDLLQYDTEATAIEIRLADGAKAPIATDSEMVVLDRFQQQANAFKMIQIEKWVTFLMLAFILIIASFNIVSTLSLLVIEKRDNMTTLRALGASQGLVRGVFSRIGLLITVIGGLAGEILGSILVLCQQWGGFIKLNGNSANLTIDVYPVALYGTDLAMVFGLVLGVAAIIALMRR